MNTIRFNAVFQLTEAGAIHGVREIQGEFDYDDNCVLESYCGKKVSRDDIEGGAITCHACLKALSTMMMRKRLQYHRRFQQQEECNDEEDFEDFSPVASCM
jgi:hypothetical protein